MGKRTKRLVVLLSAAAVVGLLIIAGMTVMDRQNQGERELYDQYAIETQKDFAKFNESIGQLNSGGLVPMEDFTGQYELTLAALENWNQVFPEFSRQGELPYVDTMNDRMFEQDDALTIIMEKMETLYNDAAAVYYGQNHPTGGESSSEELAVLADEVRCNLIVVCKRLSRAG